MNKNLYVSIVKRVPIAVAIIVPLGIISTLPATAQRGRTRGRPRERIEDRLRTRELPGVQERELKRALELAFPTRPLTRQEKSQLAKEELNRGDLIGARKLFVESLEPRPFPRDWAGAVYEMSRERAISRTFDDLGDELRRASGLPPLEIEEIKKIDDQLIGKGREAYERNELQRAHELFLPILAGYAQPLAKGHALAYLAKIDKRLLNEGHKSYQQRSWPEASDAFETILKNAYAANPIRRRAQELLERTRNLASAEAMPEGTLILDILSSSDAQNLTVHLASKGLDLAVRVDSLDKLPQSKGWQSIGPETQTVVITPTANKIGGNQFDYTRLFPGKVVWRDPYLDEAATNLSVLSQQIASLDEFAVALLLPRDPEQQHLMGLEHWTNQDRNDAWQAGQVFLKESAISDLITWRVNRGGILGSLFEALGWTRARENLLEALQTKKGVLIFFAHGNREKLYLPDGNVVTAEEISRLHFPNRPVVFLFSCEGGKTGAESEPGVSFAEALKKAGARAVWSFEEKVDAREVSRLATKFVERVRSRKTPLTAIQETVLEWQARKGPRVRMKAEIRVIWPANSVIEIKIETSSW